jgi:hypothetical protein
MIINYKIFIGFSIALLIGSCSSGHYFVKPKAGKYEVGVLTNEGYNAAKQILASYTNLPLKDTIIIKYNYNNMTTCWNALDNKWGELSNDSIQKIKISLSSKDGYYHKIASARPMVSVFYFKEPGSNFNKIIKWNTDFITDNNKQLLKLLFANKSNCGNSIIILPNKKFVFINGDPHFEVLRYSAKEIEAFLVQSE